MSEAEPKSFYDELADASPAYAELREEKAIQAAEKVQENVQAQRREYFVSHAKNNNGVVTPSPLPYAKHYAKILPKASDLFRERELHFVDVGSAPGGMSRFLCKDLHWSGRAFSLSERTGGFKMMFGGGDRLKYSMFDMSAPDAWKTLLNKLEEKDEHGDYSAVDFVNLGITLQWQPPSQQDTDGTNDSPRNHRLVLQEIIRNELLFALKILKQGGSMMLTLPTSDHPNTFLYLSFLRRCSERIRILQTPKRNRNPVYVLVQEIDVESDGVSNLRDFLESTKVSPENDAKWSIGSWSEARPVFIDCKKDFEKVWRRQRKELEKERIANAK